MPEIVGALLRTEGLQEFSNSSPCCFDAPFFRLSDKGFELCEHHLNGIEIGAVGRQEEEMRANIPDRITGMLAFMTSQIVENDDIATFQSGHQTLADPCGEGDTVDGTVEHKGCDDAVAAQASQKGQRLPMAMGDFCDERLSSLTPATGSRHVGFDPGFIDEDKAIRIKPMLVGLPTRPEPSHLRPVLLACHQCFF